MILLLRRYPLPAGDARREQVAIFGSERRFAGTGEIFRPKTA